MPKPRATATGSARRHLCRHERRCIDCGAVYVRPGDPATGGRRVRCRPCQRTHEKGLATPEQFAAHQAVKKALGDRYLRPDYCQRCAIDCKPVGHHFAGYDGRNALKVVWLCNECHALAHAEMRLAERIRTGEGACHRRDRQARVPMDKDRSN